MDTLLRKLRALVAIVLAAWVTTLPACGSMGGGGGMKYLIEPTSIFWLT